MANEHEFCDYRDQAAQELCQTVLELLEALEPHQNKLDAIMVKGYLPDDQEFIFQEAERQMILRSSHPTEKIKGFFLGLRNSREFLKAQMDLEGK